MACFASVASFQAKWGVGPCAYLSLMSSFTRPNVLVPLLSWPIRLCPIRSNFRDVPFGIYAARPRRVREIRQIHPSGTGAQGGSRWVHPHGHRRDFQLVDRVRVIVLAPL